MNEYHKICCKDPSNHAQQWYFTHPTSNKEAVCFACIVLSLEDRQLLNVRKKININIVLDVLRSNPQTIMHFVQKEEQVSLHTAMIFLSLCCGGTELLVKPAMECLLLFLIHMKKELRLAVAQKLTVEIREECNYVRSLPHFHVLGHLFQLFPELSREFINQNSQFLHFMASGMTYPSEDVRSASAYIFLQVYSSDSAINKESLSMIDSFVAKGILYVLKSGLNKDVIKNGLALLKVFLSQHSTKRVLLLLENSSEDISFMVVIKKIILTSEPVFQICIVQCLCKILSESSSAEVHIRVLIEENIPELLLEVISGNNELLVETILCCLLMLSRYTLFYEKCHVMYGVTTILDVVTRLLSLKNWKLLCLAFNLLTSLVSSDQYLMAASTQTSLFHQALLIVEKSYQVHSPQVLFAVNKFFFHLLKLESLPFPLPFSQLCSILHLCLKNVQRFLSSHLHGTALLKKSQGNCVENLPFEVKVSLSGLDIIYFFIRILKQYNQNPVSIEERFACPVIENTDEFSKQPRKTNSQPIMQKCVVALDEIFVPYCLHLSSHSFIGKISWYHLINVLSAIFEDPFDDSILMLFVEKLIKAKIFNYIWDIKVDEMLISDNGFDGSKDVCNKCLKYLLNFVLLKQQVSHAYLSCLENGITNLNCPMEECSSILSQKAESQTCITNVSHLHSMQATFLCLVYVSYLHDGPIVNARTLIPHLIYYITCNSDGITESVVPVKHLIFILAVCMYENFRKFQTGLIEVSGIMWDVLSKVTSPEEVYTHHKVLLWWCFMNQKVNSFSSFVLQTWLEYSQHTTDTFLILVKLLCTNEAAQETFVRQFESSPKIRFYFLKKVFESEIFKNEEPIVKERFEKLIQTLAQHIQVSLTKNLVAKNYTEKMPDDSFLSLGLECILWCQDEVCNSNSQVDIKLVFHVANFCCNTSCEDEFSFVNCLKYLQFAVKLKTNDSKAWYVVTGNTKIVSFLRKCLALHGLFEIEALHLLVLMLEHQTHSDLKSNTCMKMSLVQILKWMNCSSTKILSFKLLSSLLEAQFKGTFLQITSLEQNAFPSEEMLSRNDIRILAIYFQNAIMVGHPAIENVALSSYVKLLNYISKIDPDLENHIMLQPWLRILLESRLEDIPTSWDLFEKWFNFSKENITLLEVMNQFADRLLTGPQQPILTESQIMKLCTGVYKKYIPNETKAKLKGMVDTNSRYHNAEDGQENDFVAEVESIVSNYISNISSNTKSKSNAPK